MPEFNAEEFARAVDRVRTKAQAEGRLRHDPPVEELERLAEREPNVRRTKYGSLVAISEPMSRSAPFTKNSVDTPFGKEELDLLAQMESNLGARRLISIDRTVGRPGSGTVVRLTVPEDCAHIPFGGRNLFSDPPATVDKPDYEIIMFHDEAFEGNKSKPLPEKDITIRLALLDDGRVIKVVRNSNYVGEYKKGVFASEDWAAKTRRGGIFLHTGCREDYLKGADGEYRTTRTLLAALSANGKTTTTSRIMARHPGEKSWLVQDDGGTLMRDGSFNGFEAGGLYVKTEGVNPAEQTEIYYSLLRPGTFSENVHVDDDGEFDFYNLDLTANGRSIVKRSDIMHTSSFIDVPKVDNLVLITRGQQIPAISRLTLIQAVAFMSLGQAMESSAGDPTQAGKLRAVFFYDPFVAGNRAEHANLFYDILQGLPDIDCYLINTGGIGEGDEYHDIKLEHTLGVLEALVRGDLVDWVDSPTGLQVPKSVPGVDDIYSHPERLYSAEVFAERMEALNLFRREAIEKIGDGLRPEIKAVFG